MSKSAPSRGYGGDNKANDEDSKERSKVATDVIVIDIGTGVTKAGWAGEDAPRCAFPTLVLDNSSHAQAVSALDDSKEKDLVGHEASQELHDSARRHQVGREKDVIRPVVRGEIVNMKAIHTILEHIYNKELKVDSSKYPVLLTNSPLASKESRSAMAQKLFKDFRIPGLFIANASVLALFSTGRTTGVVLEAGASLCSTVPVFEGCALPYATLCQHLGGADCTQHLMDIMQAEEMPPAQFDVANNIKEQRCAVYLPDSHQPQLSPDDIQYELPGPNGPEIITIGDNMRYQPSEVLFDPEGVLGPEDEVVRANLESDAPPLMGVHKLLEQSISKCDLNLQRDLLQNIVLVGGTSMLNGFHERVKREMNLLYGHGNVQIILDSQRKHGAWIGGSMFGTLPTFPLLMYTRHDHMDPSIVHKKYF